MIIWEAEQNLRSGDVIKIQFIYLKRKKEYKVKVRCGKRTEEETFKPSRIPEDDVMDFKDLNEATKIANRLYKRLK